MSKQYVQHISGQGEKWAVDEQRVWEYDVLIHWPVKSRNKDRHILPASEYRLCDPPEVWEEVNVQIVEHPHAKDHRDPGGIYDGGKKLAQLLCGGTHRIKTLIVEKKVTE